MSALCSEHGTSPVITNIQKYAIHDGTGIRTTVFFKGCPLSCLWCHNPETQRFAGELLFYEDRCVGCGACAAACPEKAVTVKQGKAVTDRTACIACGQCADECLYNAREPGGRSWSISELILELRKDMAFYETSGGGVTLSGGEVLAQDMDYLEKLMRGLHEMGIRVNIDTCGAAAYERIARILPYTDTFLYDMKLLDAEKHRACTGADNHLILQNLIRLSGDGARIWIRIPVIGGVNDSPEEIGAMGAWLKEHRIRAQQICLLPYHTAGSEKYPRIGRSNPGKGFTVPDDRTMEALKTVMESRGIAPVRIGG